MKRISFAVLATAISACGSVATGGPTGGAQAWISNANGSIKSSDNGSTIAGTVSKAEVFAVHTTSSSSSGSTDLGVIDLVAAYDASNQSAGQLAFTAPAGITSVTLLSTVGIKGTPSGNSDYTNTGTNACGGLELIVSAGNTSYIYSALSPYNCNDSSSSQVPAGSSFDLHLNSVAELDSSGTVVTSQGSGSWAYYKVAGSLNATLVSSTAGQPDVTVSLTF